ncbi:MAG: hypothetical protein CMI31_10490 [Opitutae bacterium]|nr:hypothetical protein [Opitutae bacterium]|tara:strand:- start:3157 stop:3411 length:255 start_codon:yes stop_codon:yes gene_type:complete
MRTKGLEGADVNHPKVLIEPPMQFHSVAGSQILELVENKNIQMASLSRQSALPRRNEATRISFAIELYFDPSSTLGSQDTSKFA